MSSHLMYRENVGMVERSGSPRLLLESPQAVGIVRQNHRQHFDGNFTAQACIAGTIDLSHATDSDPLDDLVRTDSAADPVIERLVVILATENTAGIEEVGSGSCRGSQ